MSEQRQPTFLVSAYSEPVVVQINGKANYLNCNTFREFVETMLSNGKRRILLDFEQCKGMDSTFLGILASIALELREQTPVGMLIICNLSERNHALICNLGLHNLLTIGEDLPDSPTAETEFYALKNVAVADAKNMLKAHQDLVRADTKNAAKFQDVIAFLKNQVESNDTR